MCGNTGLPERHSVTTVERILEEARTLSESEACALLDFIGYLKYKRARSGEPVRDIREGKTNRWKAVSATVVNPFPF